MLPCRCVSIPGERAHSLLRHHSRRRIIILLQSGSIGKGKREYDAKRCSRRYRKFKEGGKCITFLTNDGKLGDLDKVLAFIQ